MVGVPVWLERQIFSSNSRPVASTIVVSFSSKNHQGSDDEDVTVVSKNRNRRRHRFGRADEIPSFRDFQKQMQVRSLYRQFTRLVRTSSPTASSNGPELQGQIRREFRLPQQDSWHIQRALSEGGRRYKELSAMLGNSVKRNRQTTATPIDSSQPTYANSSSSNAPPASITSKWPWNQTIKNGPPQRPSPFPPKSNL